MANSLAIIIVLGLIGSKIFEKIKLPGLLGMIIVGVIIGPYGLDILSKDILMISDDLRKIALIVILLRAGLGLKKEDLKEVGRPAINLSFIPGLFEGFTIIFLSMKLFNLSFIESGILGFIIAAVSPAVIVPSMLSLIDRGIGNKKKVPTLILAGASIDDVFAITIFSIFLGIYGGSQLNIGKTILSIPLSIILGILIGVFLGILLVKIFDKFSINVSKKVLYVLSIGILLTTFESLVESKVKIAGLLGIMALGFIINEKMPKIGSDLSDGFNKIWSFSKILLFVLVGAQVNLPQAFDAGFKGAILIISGLIGRSIGVLISLIGTNLNKKEKLFSVIAYTPKATVQAAIGGVPLSLGVKSDDLILSLAVLSIILTAPIGAIAIEKTGPKLLE